MSKKVIKIAETKTLPIGEIKPYWRNPRRIPQDAIDGVARSIKDYGYQQPIVVDKDNVIVVGHTRHQALKQLGYTEVEVYVTTLPDDKVREYRLVDNRTGEMSSWDQNALLLELREMESELLAFYWPHTSLEIEQVKEVETTQADVDQAARRAMKVTEAPPLVTVDVECPACFHVFPVKATALPGLSMEDLDRLTA